MTKKWHVTPTAQRGSAVGGWPTCRRPLDREYQSGSETSLSAWLRTASCSRLWNAWMKNRMYVTRSCVCQARSVLCSFTTRLKKAGNLSMCAEKPVQAGTFSLNFSLTMVCSRAIHKSASLFGILYRSLEPGAYGMPWLVCVRIWAGSYHLSEETGLLTRMERMCASLEVSASKCGHR